MTSTSNYDPRSTYSQDYLRHFTDEVLTEQAADSCNLGGARAAECLLTVPSVADRALFSSAAMLYSNTVGGRSSSAHWAVVRGGSEYALRLLRAERARAQREHEVRRVLPGAVVFHDGSIGRPDPVTGLIES